MAKAMIAFLMVCVLVLLTGCALFGLKDELVQMETTFGLNGKIFNASPNGRPILAVLYTVDEGDWIEVADYSIPDPAGHHSFMVSDGVYYITAFEDANRSFTYDEGERFGLVNGAEPIREEASRMRASGKGVLLIDINLHYTEGYPKALPRFLDVGTLSGESWVKVGLIADLDDPLFAQDHGYLGYWKPFTFLRDIGVGIYFVEPYDSHKIPLLFVHGANGTPIGFKTIVEKLDRSRYQAWFYFYPSGLRIDAVAGALDVMVRSLHQNFGFERMVVAAHSMGGLVSRAFIHKNSANDQQRYVRKLIAMSTPWGGVKTASMGVKNAPVVVPNWYDVSPDSDFIESLYERPLPDHVAFFLMFGVHGNCSIMMANNDGTIEISSEIDYRA